MGKAAKKAASKAMTAETQRQQLASTIARPAKVLIRFQHHHIACTSKAILVYS